jgi:hypothetical protein
MMAQPHHGFVMSCDRVQTSLLYMDEPTCLTTSGIHSIYRLRKDAEIDDQSIITKVTYTSLDHNHPSPFDFLRSDIKNVEDFFSKIGVRCLGLRRCFEFIVKEQLDTTDSLNVEDVFREWLELGATENPPGTLGELYDPEREVAALSLDD